MAGALHSVKVHLEFEQFLLRQRTAGVLDLLLEHLNTLPCLLLKLSYIITDHEVSLLRRALLGGEVRRPVLVQVRFL